VVAIRRFVRAVSSLEALVELGSASPAQRQALTNLVLGRANLVVSGGTGTGKTTLLNLLAAEIPAGERIVTIEDAAELSFPGHVIRLEGRPANAEGSGAITMRALLRSALRLRPDRIVVGEVRGPEALDMISALNTGHSGSMSTVHANSPEEALWRLETLALSGDERVGEIAVRRQLRSAVDVVVQLDRRGGRRRISTITTVGYDGVEELVC
jgi:pilus assembly protein CpaF